MKAKEKNAESPLEKILNCQFFFVRDFGFGFDSDAAFAFY
jgi:hypothetical protein